MLTLRMTEKTIDFSNLKNLLIGTYEIIFIDLKLLSFSIKNWIFYN